MRYFICFILLIAVFSCAPRKPPQNPAINVTENVNSPPWPRIHFATASFEIEEKEKSKLLENVYWMKAHPNEVFVLEGHSDERGDGGFNEELGDRRARKIKAWLGGQGVDEERIIMVVSYGKEKPLDPAHSEEAWQKNRRVEFIIR